MAFLRSRIKDYGTTYGSYDLYGSVFIASRTNGYEKCEDASGKPFIDKPLFITRSTRKGGVINGSRSNIYDGTWSTWNNVPIDLPVVESGHDFATTEGAAVARAFAVTNPARHNVSLPAFVAEMKDYPKMLRFAGRILKAGQDTIPLYLKAQAAWSRQTGANPFGRALTPAQMRKLLLARLTPSQQGGLSQAQILAAANLAFQFGWAPVISDLRKMLDFQAAVDSRRNEINRLFSGSGLKRRVTLQNDTKDYIVKDVVVSSVAGFVEVDVTVHSLTKRWVTMRYRPSSPSQLPPTDARLRQQMLGLTLHGGIAAAWEVLPWSWLVDWFTNVSDVLSLTNNEFDTLFEANTMSYKSVTFQSPTKTVIYPNDGSKTVSAYRKINETKQRSPGLSGSGPFSVKMPSLGINQLSILGSLALLRGF